MKYPTKEIEDCIELGGLVEPETTAIARKQIADLKLYVSELEEKVKLYEAASAFREKKRWDKI